MSDLNKFLLICTILDFYIVGGPGTGHYYHTFLPTSLHADALKALLKEVLDASTLVFMGTRSQWDVGPRRLNRDYIHYVGVGLEE